MNIMKKLQLKYNTILMKRRIKELESQRQPLIDLKNKYLTELRSKNLEIGRLKKKIKYLESEEYLKDAIFKNALNRDFDGYEILGEKEIEEIPLFEGTLEQLNNLSIIGDKENERN